MRHVISLAYFGMAYTHGWATNSINSRIRLKAKCERLEQRVAQLTEEIRIKDARMARLDARNRPHYPATERMAILLLRAAHGWSLKQTAKRFLVTSATIASWGKRVDEQGTKALLQLWEPVNKFPDFVRYCRPTAEGRLSRYVQGEDCPDALSGRPSFGQDNTTDVTTLVPLEQRDRSHLDRSRYPCALGLLAKRLSYRVIKELFNIARMM